CDGRNAGDVAFGGILFQGISNKRRRHQSGKRESQRSGWAKPALRQNCNFPRSHSPGSSVVSGFGDNGLWPPMAIIRSMAVRAFAEIPGSTVMWCSRFSSELRTFGSVVTFMKAQTASSLAGKNRFVE